MLEDERQRMAQERAILDSKAIEIQEKETDCRSAMLQEFEGTSEGTCHNNITIYNMHVQFVTRLFF